MNCTEQNPCHPTTCGCPIPDLSAQCVIYDGEELTCIGAAIPENLNVLLKKFDTAICDKLESISGQGGLVNIGDGIRLYAGVDNQGQKQIRTLISSDNSLVIELNEEEDTVDIRLNTVISSDDSSVISFRVDPNTKDEILSEVNGAAQFSLAHPADTLVKAIFVTAQGVTPFESTTKIYQLITKPAFNVNPVTVGLFGTGGQTLVKQNLELIETYNSTVQDLSQVPGAQVFALGNIGNVSVVNYISDVVPSLTFQNPNTNINIITATTNGVEVSYLYIGTGGTYGENNDPLGLDEIQLLEQDNSTGAETLSPNFLNVNLRQELDMSNVLGNYYNLTSPASAFQFLLLNKVPGGKALIRTNANTGNDPTQVNIGEAGLKKSLNAEWQDNIDMDIEVFVRGDLTVEWSFKPTVNQ